MLKTSIHLHLCSTSANKYDSLWLCVSVGPACSSLKHKTSSGKLGHGSSASLIKCSSFLYMTVTSICYDLMLKSSAQVRLQMRSNACSTIPTLFCHIKHIREREERVQAGDSHHHGSCGVLGILQCPGFFAVVVESHVVHSESLLYHPSSAWEAWVGWVFGSSLAWDVRVGVVFQILISMRQSGSGFWSLISMRGESGRGLTIAHGQVSLRWLLRVCSGLYKAHIPQNQASSLRPHSLASAVTHLFCNTPQRSVAVKSITFGQNWKCSFLWLLQRQLWCFCNKLHHGASA